MKYDAMTVKMRAFCSIEGRALKFPSYGTQPAPQSGLQSRVLIRAVLSFWTSMLLLPLKSVIDFNRHWFSYQLENPRMLTSSKLIPRCPARTLKVRVDWILKKTKTGMLASLHWSELNMYATMHRSPLDL